MTIEKIKVPDIGDVDGVEVIEILVAVGDTIEKEDVIVTLESEKATLEVPSSAGGIVKKIITNIGDEVSEGSDLLEIEVIADEASATKKEQPKQEVQVDVPKTVAKEEVVKLPEPPKEIKRKPPPVSLQSNTLTGKKAHASPAIRKYARELGTDINLVSGTGRKGRITKEDVKSYIKQAM